MTKTIALAPDLHIQVMNLSSRAEGAVAEFLSHFDSLPPTDRTSAPLVLRGVPRAPLTSIATLVASRGVRALRDGQSLVLLSDHYGVRCADGVAEVFFHDESDTALMHFATATLPAVLLELAWFRGWIGIHAAAVAVGRTGLLLPGPSGCGKSTIFVDSLRQGLEGLSDDLVLVQPTGPLFSLRPLPRGRPFPPSPPPTINEAILAAIVFPEITQDREARLARLSEAASLERLLAEMSLLVGPPLAAERFRCAVRLAAVPSFVLHAGSERSQSPRVLASLAARLAQVSRRPGDEADTAEGRSGAEVDSPAE